MSKLSEFKIFVPLVAIIVLAGCVSGSRVNSAGAPSKVPGLKELWSVASLASPESAYSDAESGFVYISNMAGGPTDRSGKGWIQKVSLIGQTVTEKWATGLNSPKGIRVHKGILWTTAVDEIVGIKVGGHGKIKDGQIIKRIKIPQAQCLNDIEVSPDGTVFASDIFGNKIFSVKNGKTTVFLEGPALGSPNGLLVRGGQLIVVSSNLHLNGAVDFDKAAKKGHVLSFDLKTKEQKTLSSEAIGMLDGMEEDGNGNLVVSDWFGSAVYRIARDGTHTPILQMPGNTADFSFSSDKRIIFIPLTGQNVVKAFAYP